MNVFWQQVRRFTAATAGLASIEGVSLVSGFALAVALGQTGGAELLGVFSAAFATVTIASLFIDVGFDIELARYVPTVSPEKARNFFSNVRISKVWTWIIATMLIISSLLLQHSALDTIYLHIVLLITILFRCLNGSAAALLRTQNAQQHYIRFEIPSILIEHLVSIALILYTTLPIAIVLLPFAIASAVRYKLYNATLVRYTPNLYSSLQQWYKPDLRNIAIIWQKGFTLALTTIFSGVESRIGVVLLQHFCTSAEAGIYAAALRFYNVLRIIPGALFQLLLPLFATKQSKHTEQIGALATGGMLGIVGAAVLFWLAEPVTMLAFGKDFAESSSLFSLLSLRFLFFAVFIIAESYLLAVRRTGATLGIILFGMVATIGGGIWLLPDFGAFGIVQLQTILLFLQLCCAGIIAFFHLSSQNKQ